MTSLKEEVLKIVAREAENAVIKNDEDLDKPLKEIGIDSLDTMSILLKVEEKYRISIPEKEIGPKVTLRMIMAIAGNLIKS
jgi:acyl carrier protein